MVKGAFALGWFAAGALLSVSARADPQWRLLYVRSTEAESCPSEMELRLAVAARLGRDPFSSGASNAVVARVARRGDDLTGTVEIVDASGLSRGTRELGSTSAQCDEMTRAMALSISLALAPELAAPPLPVRPPRAAGESAAETARRVPSTRPSAAAVDRGASTAVQSSPSAASLSIAATSAWGVAPSLAWGGAARVQVRRDWFAFAAGGVAVKSVGAAPSGLSTSLAAAAVEACITRSVAELCALAVAGAAWARAEQVSAPRTAAGSFVAGGGRLGMAVAAAPRVAVGAEVSLLGVMAPIQARVDGIEVWKGSPLVGMVGVGARFDFL